ncbi:cellulose synthase/poly-beta-1,6-N-acetylglucosamine synthase-like glycosyltransferase [Planomicrobium soli]|uniref:Cellulose synthase/poly-beta-1,6-N-acetylglucosamine synthase-like glycosyltransferase n=1 Tax=Planomicrobium soli TaxID=1176648 RepID=A0A2P8H5M0_9BACL|nr:glycosyltransferase [Planomicrobium soli]PSL41503.1 cellulose synthase/poly-beta-1,6-N-acetylglucosamine synthase-like glycosyltransferase [Planomicrobium soli]
MEVVYILAILLWVVFFSIQGMYLIMGLKQTKKDTTVRKDLTERKMSILVPAYNEEKVLASCFTGFKNLDYKNFELIIINDGSSDNSMKLLHDLLDLKEVDLEPKNKLTYNSITNTYVSVTYPNVKVLDKLNGGKADALNAGADYALGEIIITLDADSILQKNALIHVNEAMEDPNVLAGGGMVHVGQMYQQSKPSFKGKGLVRYQLSDYMLSFYVKRFVQSKLGVVSVVSGAFGAFRAFALYEIGGYKKTVGEDMEITLNVQKLIKNVYKKGKLVFIPKAECYTEVPDNYGDLKKQRIRWQKGFLDSLMIYRKRRKRDLGFKLVFFIFLDSLLPGYIGIVTTFLLAWSIITGKLLGLTAALLAATAVMQILQRMGAYAVSKKYGYAYSKMDYIRIFLFSVVELVTYRLLDMYFFIYGSIAFVFQRNHKWNKMERSGDVFIYANDIVYTKPGILTNTLPLQEAATTITVSGNPVVSSK